MTRYFKAVRPDGTDFRTGKINYAAALGGGPITLPKVTNPRCCTGRVLHASDVATETLIGGSWPCRLFLVEGEPVAQKGHKFGFFSLRVVEEVDARLALGPNADAVIGVIDRASQLTVVEAEKLAAAEADAGTALDAALAVALESALDAERHAAGYARAAAWRAADAALATAADAAWAAGDAALAVMVRDLISDADYMALAGPWESVMGPVLKEADR